ncbi:two-component regulator propeller domain-containing protein [Algoriphagus sp. D3-2-R+10]|uniref:ligand-binding sensor domain-containing protein n=1 Tax=Algoriphagus aurantiacus TaxID=3103948 RepID=UPI002B3C37D4|nr:two-component regulator propeller domain-containing protein [Algoriphagus sp. D3-2-R+10]MEB2774310.1 two-component regulator propeller domain-containing protein [Algoriphagus sp. D3-2-R+10]
MKYAQIYTLVLMLICHTSCGQKQTSVPKQNNRSHRSGLSESQLKEAAASKVPMSMVRNVRQAKNGDILIASYLGIYRYDGASLPTGQAGFTNMTSTIEWPTFWDVLEDRKGNLWLASQDSGVYFQPAEQNGFKHFKAKDGTGISSALDIYEDRAGNIWFGASRYDGKSFRSFTTKDGFPSNNIRLLLEDKTGKLWFGAHGEDMFVYDARLNGEVGQGKTFTVLKNKDGKAFNNVWSIIEDKKGNIWFGAPDGLWRYDGNTFTHVSQRGAYAIIQDKKGNIWTTGEVKLYGNVWALSRYDAKSLYNEKPTVTEIMSQSQPAMLLGILEDDDGNIWFGSGGGVYRYDGKAITDFKSAVGQK